MMKYTNWTVKDENGIITISADTEHDLNPALMACFDKKTGAVFVQGSPKLLARQSTGKAMDCIIELFGCVFSMYPNNHQVPLVKEEPQEGEKK